MSDWDGVSRDLWSISDDGEVAIRPGCELIKSRNTAGGRKYSQMTLKF